MASPSTYKTAHVAPPPTAATSPNPGKFTGGMSDAGVPNADRIPIYVSGIIILSALSLVGLHRLKFRMIVGAN